MTAFLDNLVALSGGAVAYLIVLGLVSADGIAPVVPGEVAMITGGALAAQGRLTLVWLVAAGLGGAILGDNASFLLGRTIGTWAERRFFSGEKSSRRLAWARRQLHRHTLTIIAAGRFVPGGRTAATFAAGSSGVAWRRFAAADFVGCAGWVTYAIVLGWAGGSTFRHTTWKALLLSAGIAVLVVGAIELVRRLSGRFGTRRAASEAEGDASRSARLPHGRRPVREWEVPVTSGNRRGGRPRGRRS